MFPAQAVRELKQNYKEINMLISLYLKISLLHYMVKYYKKEMQENGIKIFILNR